MRIEWTKKAGTDMGRLPVDVRRRICTKVEYDAMREHIEDPEDILAACRSLFPVPCRSTVTATAAMMAHPPCNKSSHRGQ